MREVAVMMCELPAVREVKRKRRGSFSKSLMSIWWDVMVGGGGVEGRRAGSAFV